MQVSEIAPVHRGKAYDKAKAAFDRYEEICAPHVEVTGEIRLERVELRKQLDHWHSVKSKNDKAIGLMGKRYENCSFDNYVISNKDQEKVVTALREYAANTDANINEGRNVLLIGPKGTGKDHLLAALSRAVLMESGVWTEWKNGVDLLTRFHFDALNPRPRVPSLYDDDEKKVESVLYISDPLPPTGELTPSMQRGMFELVDNRYRSMEPIWMSMNVFDGAEAGQRMGEQTVDRLKHNALILRCNWESYRRAGT